MEADFPTPSISLKEGFMENVLDKAPFGFSLMSGDYVVEFANDVWLEIAHKTREEVTGKNLFDLFPEAKDQLITLCENVRESRKPFHAPEFCIKLERNGVFEEIFFNFIYHPVYNDDGEFLHFVTVAMEVTEMVGIKSKIREDEERLRLATESSQTATWDLDMETHEIIHSPYLSQIFGYSHGEKLTQEQLRSHIPETEIIDVVDKAFKKALETGIYQYEAKLKDKKGQEKWIFTNGKVFFDDEGKPKRMLGVLQDVTERKKSEILLQQSHHQLNTALDATKLGLFEMNPITQEKYNFSPRFLEIFGYDPETEIIDSHIFEKHIHKNFAETRVVALQRAKETGDLHYQTKIVLRDGSTKWIELYGRLLEATDIRKAYISGTIRDITELKNFEKKISESERKYRFLADSMPQIVWIAEPNGELTYFNKSTTDYSGKSYDEFIEENAWLEMMHPEERKENIRLWAKSVRTKKPFFFEHRFRNANNEYRWFMTRAFPELDESGNVKKWVGTSTDINDMKKMEQQKNDFIKMANHELKTPVTTIKGYVQLLKKMRKDSEDQFLVNSLNTIENQVNKLNILIGDLLDISRIESGTLPLNKKTFSLVELVTETIEDIKASEQSHQINFELMHASDIEVFADKDRITQVLNNLLTNAIKYSPHVKTVNVKLSADHECAIVSVEDFGIGMDPEELNKIFERFYRVSGDDEETFPGFGIGLFIVKDILEKHKGKIWVESEKEKGSQFFFSIPLSKN
ncbi:PAS domain-containing sensor histidine kinase [Chryseobacterium sp.]|uniref:PAS domain-containing sensor histidine kinase n=1 Tax=Chryseobacterium sp. TaxID=1871047 RepID=UPI0011C72600|nr:PAS domain-containing sensor histidine kinase [Chryseobacterium sp.]TXF76056.1 PAS domain-containing sensor histidine kinase [Chryseobacterium sp.]